MTDDALGDDLVIDEAFIRRVKRDDGRCLDLFINLSDDKRQKLRDDHVITIIENYFNADEITIIELSYCPGITDTTIKHISTNCTNLESLNYSHCTGCTDAALEGTTAPT